MDLQRSRPRLRRCLRILAAASLAGLVLVACLPAPLLAVDNGGLGPLSIRDQFPVALPFLSFTPEPTLTLPAGDFQLRYQYARSNTFINTQAPNTGNTPVIDGAIIDQYRGDLTQLINYFPATGYGLYIDVESVRHLLRLNYGLAEGLEVGLELSWLSYSGGFLDSNITSVEDFFGGLNKERTYSRRNRFDYYVVRNGRFLQATSASFSDAPQDPVIDLKWNWGEGGDVLPAVSLKLAYKQPLESHPGYPRNVVSSGRSDYGYYLLISKAVGDVVGHFQFGTTVLGVPDDTYAHVLHHKLFGLEFRLSPTGSVLLQSLTQSSIFIKTSDPTSQDFPLSRATDVLMLGYKHHGESFLAETGLVEDYNSTHNEADITLYLELGWQW